MCGYADDASIMRSLLCAKSLFSKHDPLKFSYRASSPRNIFNRVLFWHFRAPRSSLVREYEAPTPKTERVSSDLLLKFYVPYHGTNIDPLVLLRPAAKGLKI